MNAKIMIILMILSLFTIIAVNAESIEPKSVVDDPCIVPTCDEGYVAVGFTEMNDDGCQVYECQKKVCCMSYGIADSTEKINVRYSWAGEGECKVSEDYAGGGKEIVDSSNCLQDEPACMKPVCDGKIISTGNFYENGCEIYKCITTDISCTIPICEEGKEAVWKGDIREDGCKVYVCDDPDITCDMPICEDGANPVPTGKYGDNGCEIYECPKEEIVCEMPICKEEEVTAFTGKYSSEGCKIYECKSQNMNCLVPICDTPGLSPKWTGEIDEDGCKVFRCMGPDIACEMPICDDDEEALWTGETNKDGCKVFKCSKGDIACEIPTCRSAQGPVFTGKIDDKGCKVFVCEGDDMPTPIDDSTRKEIIKVGDSNEEDCSEYRAGCEKGYKHYCIKWDFNCDIEDKTITTKEKLMVEDEKAYLNDKEIKIMPKAASEKAFEVLFADKDVKIELKDTGKPVYEVEGFKEGKLFGLFRKDMKITTEIDGETGEVISTKKPWWAFLYRADR